MKKKKMKVKKKKSFPDVSGDGKITKKDILAPPGPPNIESALRFYVDWLTESSGE